MKLKNLKKLFIVPDDDGEKEKQPETPKTSFPTSPSGEVQQQWNTQIDIEPVVKEVKKQFPVATNQTECDTKVVEIVQWYLNDWKKANFEGNDYYEFHQAVGDTKSKEVYVAMYNFLKINVGTLLEDGNKYIEIIENHYNDYVSKGRMKRDSVITEKNTAESRLSQEVKELEDQKRLIEIAISDKKGELSKIDVKYAPSLEEIDCTLGANDIAKDQIVGSIQTVMSRIKEHLN